MKYLLFLSLSIISISSYSQINKGSVVFGGDISISNGTVEESSSGAVLYSEENSRFLFNPKAAVFVSKNVAIGLGVGFENTEFSRTDRSGFNATENRSSTKVDNRFINPFLDFQSKLTEKLQFNLGVECLFGAGEATYNNSSFTTNVKGDINFFEFNIVPGLYYFLSNKTAVTLNYGRFTYANYTEEVVINSQNGATIDVEDKFTGFNFGFQSFEVGFVFVFAKKAE
mgnify:CR=1 FL=1